MDSLSNTIKAVSTPNYEVILVEVPNGYKVLCNHSDTSTATTVLVDYNTASFIFDNKTQELEGN